MHVTREPDAPDLRSSGGGGRRQIPWDALDGRALGARGRETVGGSWLERMKQEHLAVGAFALLARELAEVGSGPAVLSLATRASADEVRHADVCGRFAGALLGEAAVPARLRGLPKVPMHEGASAADRVLYHVVEMCCLSETLTGVFFTEMLARTADPAVREVIESLLEDEIDHGRLGWAYLAERTAEKRTRGLPAALPAMLDRTFRHVLSPRAQRGGGEDSSLESMGYLGPRASAAIYRRALHQVILPGFETLGVDLGPARKLIADRGWSQPA
jgi:hypothetical protein